MATELKHEQRISDARMDELITRAKRAAVISTGGGDGSPLREHFSEEVYQLTLSHLVANEDSQRLND